MKFSLYIHIMKLLRVDLTKRGYVEDFELFEIEAADLQDFADILVEQETEFILDAFEEEMHEERLDDVDYNITETYLEFYYDSAHRSRFYLVDHKDNQDLIEAAKKENIDNIEYQYLNEIMQKKLQKS